MSREIEFSESLSLQAGSAALIGCCCGTAFFLPPRMSLFNKSKILTITMNEDNV